MNYTEQSKEQLLVEIDNKSKAIINMGKQLIAITPKMESFDLLLIAALNRTVNISKAYTTLIRDNNFLAAAPLVRINIDTLLRLYASIISEFDRNTFASKVMGGELIKKMKLRGTKQDLRDDTLYIELSKIEGMEWVTEIYKAGNSFVHLARDPRSRRQCRPDLVDREATADRTADLARRDVARRQIPHATRHAGLSQVRLFRDPGSAAHHSMLRRARDDN